MTETMCYVHSITIQSCKCFGETPQTLSLVNENNEPVKWTLILGDNGVGKTTLLRVISMLYYGFAEQLKSAWARDTNLWGSQVDFFCRQENFVGPLALSVSNAGHVCQYTFKFENGGKLEVTAAGGLIGAKQLPLMVGYGPQRHMTSKGDFREASSISGLIDPEQNRLVNARTWLRELDYSASKQSSIQGSLKARLDMIRNLLIDLLPDVDDIRITQPTLTDPEPDVEFRTPFGWVGLDGIAYGYQSLTAWVVDFAYRLVSQYPDSENPLAEPAVCLIDELDLHLHPSWQRDVMSYLSQRFPNTQFIATVHSPLVVQAAPSVNANVAVLRRVHGEPFDSVMIDNHPEIIRSWRLDQLLASDLFSTVNGSISPQVVEPPLTPCG